MLCRATQHVVISIIVCFFYHEINQHGSEDKNSKHILQMYGMTYVICPWEFQITLPISVKIQKQSKNRKTEGTMVLHRQYMLLRCCQYVSGVSVVKLSHGSNITQLKCNI